MFASLEAFLNELYLLKDEFFPKARFEITYSRINKVSLRLLIDIAVFERSAGGVGVTLDFLVGLFLQSIGEMT
jgi:hypothetical protein